MATMRGGVNPKDSMKSTWRHDKSQWISDHYIMYAIAPTRSTPAPVFKKTDKVPVIPPWTADRWVILHAAWPLLLHNGYMWLTGWTIPWYIVFILYSLAMQANSIHEIRVLARLGQSYGYLDGDEHVRDDVPDVGVEKASNSLGATTLVRPLLAALLSYDCYQTPSPSLWLPVELLFYSVVLDFFFYWYHRACHEVDYLWKYHRTHHLTKHPNPLLSSYADIEQEIVEIALIPVLTWAVLKFGLRFPMDYYDWWFCHEFVIFAEAMGHSGIRLQTLLPGTSKFLLGLIDGAELLVEDHDLHHRRGYRKTYNYGKQTRLWDKVFGTCTDRPEMHAHNLDYEHKVHFPLY